MIKKILVVAIALAVLLTAVTMASADHSWNGYHWPSDDPSPTVKDKTTSPLYDEGSVASVPAAVQEWADLGTPIQPTLTTAKKGDISLREGFSQSWLGIATIFLDGGHITKGEVKLNTRYLEYYEANGYPGIADHVLCQEIGHVLGLSHNRTETNTCMNDQAFEGFDLTSPNSHDTVQLNIIYDGHSDITNATETDNGGPPCSKNPTHPNCVSGVWITVHVFPLP